MESHNSTKKTISEFKTNLEKLTDNLNIIESINLPMFIFIDELDRCRPNYAIEVLENIKHLFGVPGVYFVVATASEQLSHSVKAVYGQSFDSPNYLKRFFDQTYTMQDPDRFNFSEYIFSLYKINIIKFYSPINKSSCTTRDPVIEAFALVTSLFNCGLRDMMQYCIIINSISLTFNETEDIHIIILIFLIILQNDYKDQYRNFLKTKSVDFSSLNLNLNIIGDKYFQTIEYSYTDKFRENGHASNVNFVSIINEYIKFMHMHSNNIINTTYNKLIFSEIAKNLSENHPNHSLKMYPQLVEQAGRMT